MQTSHTLKKVRGGWQCTTCGADSGAATKGQAHAFMAACSPVEDTTALQAGYAEAREIATTRTPRYNETDEWAATCARDHIYDDYDD